MDVNERRARAFTEAAEWWLQLRADQMPRTEREQFVGWLRESPLHVEEMLRISQVHDSLNQFEHWKRISTEGAADERILDFAPFPLHPSTSAPAVSDASVKSARHRARSWRRALTASSLVASMAVLLWASGLLRHTIETQRGERREVVLNDGSTLEVDPQTRLRVKFEDRTRTIILEQGRALFRVARDPARPFTVRVDETVVRAIGTAFGVERTDGTVLVTVAEGKVAVSSHSIPIQRLARGDARGATGELYLTANQQVALQREHAASPVREVDSDRELAWTQGRLVFTEDTISKAVADFNRYNHVQLRVADESLGARPVSGVFDASDPESFVAFIQTVAQVRIDRGNGRDITIASAQ